jgi:phage-related minor tail protein
MASRSLGTLTWDLIAKIGGFEQGLDKAGRKADETAKRIRKAAKDVEKEWSDAGKLIAAGFAGITIGATFAKFIQESKNAQNEQAQLAAVLRSTGQAAGYSAEQLNAMAEKMAQSSIFDDGDINKAQTRLLSYTNVVGEQFPQALQAAIDMASRLGTGVEEAAETIGKALDVPSEGLSALSKQGFRFTEDQKKLIEKLQETGRTAEAQGIILDALKTAYGGAAEAARNTFGGAISAVQNALNSLMQGSDGSLKGATEAVNELAKTLGSAEVKEAFGALTTLLANTISLLASATSHFINFGKFAGESLAKAVHGSADPIERLDEGIAGMRTELQALDKELARPRKFSAGNGYDGVAELEQRAAGLRQQLEGAGKAREDLVRQANNPAKQIATAAGPLPKPVAIKGKGGASDDSTKKLLDNELKLLSNYISEQQELLQERNKFLDLYNSQGLISIQDYYSQQQNIRDEATQNQIKAYDAQIKALKDYQSKAPKETERADAQGKINDLLAKQAKLQRDAGTAAIEAGIKQMQSAKEYQNTIAETNAKLLELQGALGEAAAIRFDLQNEGLLKLFSAEGNDEMTQKVARIRELTIAQADLNKLQSDSSLIQGQLSIQEDRIALAAQLGTQGEIEGLVKLGQARKASLEQLRPIAEAYERIAKASGDPQMILNAERMKLSIDQLAASVDPLADKFNKLFADSFADALGGLIDGTKTAKEAFQDLFNSIFKELARLAVQDIAKSLFGGGGSATGGVGFDLGSLFSGLFGGGRASGGPVMSDTLYRVNEKGPEMFKAANGSQFLMTGTSGGSITPNSALGGTTVFNINVPESVNRSTGTQIAAEAQRKLAQGRRNT